MRWDSAINGLDYQRVFRAANFPSQVAKRDIRLESRGRNSGGDIANLGAGAQELVPFFRQGLQITELQAAQLLIHVTESVDAVENLLSDIAAFGIAHSLVFDAALLRKITFIHIGTKTGNASFNPR